MDTAKLYTAWQGEHAAGAVIPPHEHDCHELVYYQSGEGTTLMSSTAHRFHGGSFAVITPHVMHNEVHRKACRLICITFSAASPLPCGVWEDRDGRIAALAAALLRESLQQESGYRTALTLLTELLTVQLLRIAAPPVYRAEKSLEYAVRYIEENYHTHIIFGDLAAALHLSYSRFGHRFREIYGVSPQQYLIETRLTAADRLLKSSALTCTDIAYRCGFSTAAQFSALYKKRYGMPPRACRTE